jgi:hypothetical protein
LLPELKEAETISYNQQADSILKLLEALPTSIKMDELNHATWCMLFTQAQYRAYKEPSNDSILSIAYHYFMKSDNHQRKALVLFLEGSLHKTWDEQEEAYRYFLEASGEAKHTKDYPLEYYIYNDISRIEFFRGQYSAALSDAQKAWDYAKLAKNSMYMATALDSEARAYTALQKEKEAIEHYEEALLYAKESKDPNTLVLILTDLGAEYAYAGRYQASIDCLQQALHIKKPYSSDSPVLLSIGDTYRLMHERDSAFYYLSQVANDSDLYARQGANYALYLLNRDQYHDCDEALKYLRVSFNLSDTIQKAENDRTFIAMKEKYKNEQLKTQLELEEKEKAQILWTIFACVLMTISIIVLIYQRRIQNKERIIQKKEEELRSNAIRLHENETVIKENNRNIEMLQQDMKQYILAQEELEEQTKVVEALKDSNKVLMGKNAQFSQSSSYPQTPDTQAVETLSLQNKELKERIYTLCEKRLAENPILKNLRETTPRLDAESKEWQKVQAIINDIYDNFSEKLLERWEDLSAQDLQLCCLIKIRMSRLEMATILNNGVDAIPKKKQRLVQKLLKKEGNLPFENVTTFNLWLLSL